MFSKSYLLLTDRFYLKPLTLAHANDSYLSWFRDREVIKYIVSARYIVTKDQIKSFILEKNESSDAILLGIFDKENKKHIGNIKFEPIDLNEKYAVVGIMIGEPAYRGIGCGREVLSTAVNWICKEYKLNKVLLGVSKENFQAVKMYKKAGFEITMDSKIIKTSESNIVMEFSYTEREV